MKTIRTIATVLLAAFLVLGPLAASAATSTLTIGTNASSYSGMANITISGTVSPAPTVTSNVILTTSGPNGAVDIGSVPVATGTGTYSYTLVSGGSANWVSGTYTVNGTWGAQGNTATKTTTFAYSGVATTSSTSQSGTTTVTTTVASTTFTTTTTATTSVASTTVTVTGASDASALSSIQSSIATEQQTLTSIQNSLNAITQTLTTMSSAIAALNLGQVQTTLNGLSTDVTALTNSINSVSGMGSTLTSMSGELGTLTSAINNNQTYVLVVAALAAITLVLELAILVRKLS